MNSEFVFCRKVLWERRLNAKSENEQLATTMTTVRAGLCGRSEGADAFTCCHGWTFAQSHTLVFSLVFTSSMEAKACPPPFYFDLLPSLHIFLYQSGAATL